jgi:hypothetical protein
MFINSNLTVMKKVNFVIKSILLIGAGYAGFVSTAAAEPVDSTRTSMGINSGGVDEIFKYQNLKSIQNLSRDCAYTQAGKSCVSFFASGADSAQLDSAMGGLLLALSPSKNIRLGAYLEQSKKSQDSSGGVTQKQGDPAYGFFAMWSQDPDGSGMHVRAATNVSNVFIESTRVDNLTTNRGLSDIQSKSFQVDLIKDYAFSNNWLISPFVGYRELNNKRMAYVEFLDSNTPLSYKELGQDIQSVTFGATLALKVATNTKFALTAGVDKDVKNKIGNYSAVSTRDIPPIETVLDRGVVFKQKINFFAFSMNHQINDTSTLGFSINQRKSDRSSDEMVFGTIQFAKSF